MMNMNYRLKDKPKFEFEPKVGMKTNDCYLHGIGELDDIGSSGHIAYVGNGYFVIETRRWSSDKDDYIPHAIMVREDSYWVIEEGDFN